MIRDYRQLVPRHLRQRAGRSLLTAAAIAMATALVSALGLFLITMISAVRDANDGEIPPSMFMFAGMGAILAATILVATIAVIYNAIHISVVERVRLLGYLRAVGAARSQVRALVMREATLLALAGIPAGLLTGIAATFLVRGLFMTLAGDFFPAMPVLIPPWVLGLSAALALMTVYVSAWLPARRAGRLTPLAAIGGRGFIAKEGISLRPGLIGRVIARGAGMEGQLALRNVRRNPARYRVTVFSLTLAVLLFVVTGSFMRMVMEEKRPSFERVRIHYVLRGIDQLADSDVQAMLARLRALPEVQEATREGISVAVRLHDFRQYKAVQSQVEALARAYPQLEFLDLVKGLQGDRNLLLLASILLNSVVVIAVLIGGANIVNTLTANVLLRSRELALLRAVGLTRQGVRKTLRLEGLLYGVAGCIYGSIAGVGISFLMHQALMARGGSVSWTTPWTLLAIAWAGVLAIVYIASSGPLARANRDSLIAALRVDG